MTWGKGVCFCLWAICLLLGGYKAGRAADWELTPSIATRAEYLNNIFYSAYFKKSDYILSAVPRIDFTYNTESTHIGGGLILTGLHYLHNSNLDTINQFYNFNASTLTTSRLKLNLTASYLSTSNSTEAVNTTNVFTVRNRVDVIQASPGLTYYLTERWSTDLNYNFYNVDYQIQPFTNYLTHTVSSRLNYIYNEKTTFIASITASYSQYQKTDDNILALGPQAGFNRKISENWDITFLGGANFSQVESTVASTSFRNFFGVIQIPQLQKIKTVNVSPFINISTNCRWEKGGLSFTYTRSQSANAYLNQSQYNYFYLTFNQNLTERLKLAINPSFNIISLPKAAAAVMISIIMELVQD